jgi:nucleoid-associated protein YgaU
MSCGVFYCFYLLEKQMNELIVTESPKTLKWFHYNQNNSGGYFILNDQVGSDVFVQAYSYEEANERIEDVLEANSEYCDCCGERWQYAWRGEQGDEVPSTYGTSIYEEYDTYDKNGYAVLYYMNGLVEKYYPNGSSVIDGEYTTSSDRPQQLLE